MKKIPKELKTRIDDALLEGLINLPAQILEKDVHVTDALHAIAKVEWFSLAKPVHQHGVNSRNKEIKLSGKLVFAGGTCLSKAHGLIERMSEDIDIKVYLEPEPEGYRPLSQRARLGVLHDAIIKQLAQLGFTITAVEEVDGEAAEHMAIEGTEEAKKPTLEVKEPKQEATNPHIRDSRRFFHLTLDYESVFAGTIGALRPKIKVELIHRHTMLPSEQQTFGYLVDKLLQIEPSNPVTIECISVEETLAEKILSMLRRSAWKWYGGQNGEMDPALVRHVYDVGQIDIQRPEVLLGACNIFPSLVAKDAEEFGRQYPEFAGAAKEILTKALIQLKTDATIRDNYAGKLQPLIYGGATPTYDEAYAKFARVANEMLATIS